MGKHVGTSLVLIFLLFFLPWVWGGPAAAEPEPPVPPAGESEAGALSKQEQEPSGTGADSATVLTVLLGGQLERMDMAEYLTGVLRAEMPASFEAEALKAQAVAARTYTLHKILNGGSENHPEADVCDDINCCQAFRSQADAAADWGGDAEEYEAKIRDAVAGTDGECVLYGGQPVLAVFHSSSAGTTQDAEAVWSDSLPYLQSVETPESEDTVPGYRSTASFPAEELHSLLQAALPEADLSGSPSDWFTNIRQQANGAVTSLAGGGVEISGSRLRGILGLRSANFTLSFGDSGEAVFSVTGYGHGVGMSQYGANVLAAGGMEYRDILTWYYTGTEVGPYVLDRDSFS